MPEVALTIAIPTYNRNELLLRTVQSLFANSTENFKILILDNHSDVPVQETLLSVTESLPAGRIEIHRHEVNIGGLANMLRAFELCQTEWLWLITEKSTVKPCGITRVLKTIEEHTDCLFINFDVDLNPPRSHIPPRTKSIITTGRTELLQNILYFGSIIDQMASVYFVPRCREVLENGYLFAPSFAAQFVLVLATLRDTDRCFLSSDQVVTRITKPLHGHSRLSTLAYGQNCMSLLNLPLTPPERDILQRKLLEFMPTPKHFVLKFIILAAEGDPSAHYYFNQYANLMAFHDRRIRTRLVLLLGRLLMRAPVISVRCLDKLVWWGLKRSIYEAGETTEHFARIPSGERAARHS